MNSPEVFFASLLVSRSCSSKTAFWRLRVSIWYSSFFNWVKTRLTVLIVWRTTQDFSLIKNMNPKTLVLLIVAKSVLLMFCLWNGKLESVTLNGTVTNCRIAHNLGILLMNSNCFAIFYSGIIAMFVQISICYFT